VVRHGESDQDPLTVRKIKAGQTAAIKTGQGIVERPSDVHEAANRGSTPVGHLLATLLKTGAPAGDAGHAALAATYQTILS
jgi:hypothetical protein